MVFGAFARDVCVDAVRDSDARFEYTKHGFDEAVEVTVMLKVFHLVEETAHLNRFVLLRNRIILTSKLNRTGKGNLSDKKSHS